MIDISKLDKASVLATLYNHSKPIGLGSLAFQPGDMGRSEASSHLTAYVDYLKGRIIKVDFRGNEFDPYLYDRDNGEGTAQRAIDNIEATA